MYDWNYEDFIGTTTRYATIHCPKLNSVLHN